MRPVFKMLGIAIGLLGVAAVGMLPVAHAEKVEKVEICHKPGTADQKVLWVPAPAVEAHLAHGDQLGSCDGGGDPGGGR